MPHPRDPVITSACRTPIGAFCGALAAIPAPALGSRAIAAALERSGVSGADVDEVLMGLVVSAGAGQAPARQAAIAAGVPSSVPCTTINKVCGSGMKAVMLAAQAIRTGDADIVVAGGMESMSLAPHLLPRSRSGFRLGHAELVDSVIRDGLWDVYNDFHMGDAAELCARELSVSRSEQDAYAERSYRRAIEAQDKGWFDDEIVPVVVPSKSGESTVSRDEGPRRVDFAKIPALRPAFQEKGSVTAANASSLSDGAAALVVMSRERAISRGIAPLATIAAQATTAKAPEWFTTAPADAVAAVLSRAGLQLEDIDLFEINEAFAVVCIAVSRLLELESERLNVHGGAIALGHPIGASGARILVTLLHALRRRGGRLGLASLCIGGGEATAVIVRRE